MAKYGVYVCDDNGWVDGCQDYLGVFFGETPPGARFVWASEGSELGGHMEFHGRKAAEAFAAELRRSGDWTVKAPGHAEFGRVVRPEYAVAEVREASNA